MDEVAVVVYLCIGHVSHFPAMPELEKAGWLPRLNPDELVYFEKWGIRQVKITSSFLCILKNYAII